MVVVDPITRNFAQKLVRPRVFVALGIVLCLSWALWNQARKMIAAPHWSELKRSIRKDFPSVHQLTTEELAAWLDDASRAPPILLDARAPEEYAVSHLRNALLATDYKSASRALGSATLNTPIVVYCSVGYRSSRLAEDLAARGYSNVANLEGSIFQWANEERLLFRGLERVFTVHPYNEKWGSLLNPKFHEHLKGAR